ncbi:MAG: type IV pilin N-terminal domain-containing protein, partial [Candidatus Thermoplasmatota archaeon]|nr:type IV pilin N-terminal domain-containing protein [Candidatus Thermoplasmatota archaeon]
MALKKLKDGKLRKDKDAVSEVVGSILIIAITVTLFSALSVFVQNLPPPQESSYISFAASTVRGDDTTSISLTHQGGEDLPSWATSVYVFYEGELN